MKTKGRVYKIEINMIVSKKNSFIKKNYTKNSVTFDLIC